MKIKITFYLFLKFKKYKKFQIKNTFVEKHDGHLPHFNIPCNFKVVIHTINKN